MEQATPSLALDIQAMAQLDRWLALPRDAQVQLLADLARTDPVLHARVAQLAAASGSGTSRADPAASLALAAPLRHAADGLHPQGLRCGDLLGAWRLVRELGRGGMSVVWLAERADGSLKRQVALKLPLATHLSPSLRERFARERDVLAQLAHPHIARLYDAGVSATGQPFIALEHVVGQPITQFADERHLGPHQRLQLFQQVLAAVDHAHRHLVVHRDLKPANILVDQDGQVKLLDFGIAKLLDLPVGAADLTQEASAVMTPRYAAPEQVAGAAITTSTDVFAAGVVLYELLTGRLPWLSAPTSVAGLAHAVLYDEPMPASQATANRQLRRQLAGDIDTVLQKALQKDPAERYASVERLSEDLRRVLTHQPILARPTPWLLRLRLLFTRHRQLCVVSASALLLLTAAALLALAQYRETRAQQARGDAVRDFVFSMIADAEPAQGHSQVTGIELLDAAVARARTEWQTDPQLQAELMAELGRVYFQLHRPEQSVAVLDEALALMAAGRRGDDPVLNRTRAILARSLLAVDLPRAERVGQLALRACTAAGAGCARARAHALYALASHDSMKRRDAQTLAHANAALVQAEAGYGAQSRELVQFLEAQATAAGNVGAWDQAETAIQRAQALAAAHLLKTNLRNRLDLMQSMQDIERGRYGQAAQRLRGVVRVEGSHHEVAMQWRLLALAELGLGRPAAAVQAAAMARDALREHPQTMNAWMAQQVWAQMASANGQHAEAASALAKVEQGLLASGLAADSEPLRRVRRVQAEAMLRAGQDAQALALLQGLLAQVQAAQGSPRELSLVLTPLACAEWFSGRQGDALVHWRQAQQELDGRLAPGHPSRLRAALLVALASPGSDWQAAWRPYLAALADDSPLRHPPADCRGLI